MRINSVSYNTQRPSFGMAKLTQKGQELATTFISDMPEFLDASCYKKANLIGPMLKKIQKGADVDLSTFFKSGTTPYPTNNEAFIKKQVTGFRAKRAIDKFLSRQSKVTEAGVEMSEKGQSLIQELLNLFDVNVSNPQVSAKQGRAILGRIEDYLPTETLAPRNSIVSNSVFSK